MIWLTWRQHRMQALAAAIGLAAAGAFFLATGLGMTSLFKSSGLAQCLSVLGSDCRDLSSSFQEHYNNLQFVVPLFLAAPLLIGVFWGSPLIAREVEQGTHRMVWTQGVTRRRWFATKVGLILPTAAVGAGLFAVLVTWWSSPLVRASEQGRFSPGVFDLRGVVPIGYFVFAVALGIAAGAVIRKTLPAMAVTLGGFVAVRVIVDLFVRPHYMAARTVSYGMFTDSPRAGLGDWLVKSTIVDPGGHLVGNGGGLIINPEFINAHCPGVPSAPGGFPGKDAVGACLSKLGFRVVDVYQPGSRYWLFQGIELTLFLVLSAALVGLAMWWVRRRVS
jgi:hypothetical protein